MPGPTYRREDQGFRSGSYVWKATLFLVLGEYPVLSLGTLGRGIGTGLNLGEDHKQRGSDQVGQPSNRCGFKKHIVRHRAE
jgi:hypothetical protein